MPISSLSNIEIANKKVLLRVDFNVTLNKEHQVIDDYRIKQTIPTIQLLLKNNSKIIILSHLGRPKEVDSHFSLKPVREKLQSYLPGYTVVLLTNIEQVQQYEWKEHDIVMLENLRFFPGEKQNDEAFARQLASLGDCYVNDAFSNSHREHASIVGIPKLLPSYAGLLLEREIEMLDRIIKNPQHPIVAVIGGVKVSTKIGLIKTFMKIADKVLLGGALANTFLKVTGVDIKNSLYEETMVDKAASLLKDDKDDQNSIVLPADYIWGGLSEDSIRDIGPQTQITWREILSEARTIIWNGPVGYIEDEHFRAGTDAVFQSIINNTYAVSVAGGGQTVSAISGKEGVDRITHISTGGGAMLEYIEKGTLVGIEALTSSQY